MTNNNKLKEGDVYLSIALDVDRLLAKLHRAIAAGHAKVYVAAFKRDNANENQPIFDSDDVAIWKKKKKADNTSIERQDIIEGEELF